MATHRAAELAARTRRSSIEAASDRATAALSQFLQSADAPTVDPAVDACWSVLLAGRLAASVGARTEDHLVVEVSQRHREKLNWLRNNREAPFRVQILGSVDGRRGICDGWRGSFGDVRPPMIDDKATEVQRATACVIAYRLASELVDCFEPRDEGRELALEDVFLEADWPIEDDAFNTLAGQFREMAAQLEGDRGIRFSRHLEKSAHEGTRLPPSLQSAPSAAPDSPWVAVRGASGRC